MGENYKDIEFNYKVLTDDIQPIKFVNGDLDVVEATIQLYSLKPRLNSNEFKIIKSLVNLMNKLPEYILTTPLGEIEICCSYLDPIFYPLFSDERNKNYNTKESRVEGNSVNKQRRPDAVISNIYQSQFIGSRGYGEAKTKENAGDTYELVRDVIRINIFSIQSIDANLGFQSVGSNTKFYITSLLHQYLYTTAEILSIKTPMYREELLNFLNCFDSLLKIMIAFENCVEYPLGDTEFKDMTTATLNSPTFKLYVSSTKDRTRPTPIHFN